MLHLGGYQQRELTSQASCGGERLVQDGHQNVTLQAHTGGQRAHSLLHRLQLLHDNIKAHQRQKYLRNISHQKAQASEKSIKERAWWQSWWGLSVSEAGLCQADTLSCLSQHARANSDREHVNPNNCSRYISGNQHSFGLDIQNDMMSALGRPQDMLCKLGALAQRTSSGKCTGGTSNGGLFDHHYSDSTVC